MSEHFNHLTFDRQPTADEIQVLREVVPADDEWHQVQVVFRGTRPLAVYIDGKRTAASVRYRAALRFALLRRGLHTLGTWMRHGAPG